MDRADRLRPSGPAMAALRLGLLLALASMACRDVDVVVGRARPEAAGLGGAGGLRDASGGEDATVDLGTGGVLALPEDAGRVLDVTADRGGTGGSGGAFGKDASVDAGGGTGADGIFFAEGGRGEGGVPGPALCPAPAAQPAPFFQGAYIEVGNILVDASYVYLKISDCCVDAPGYTVRVPRGGGPAEAIHTSARYHTGLAQDADNLYLSASEGLKTFSKRMGTLSVVPGLAYKSLAVHQGRVFGLTDRRIESVDGGRVTVHADGSYAFAELVVDARGIYATNQSDAGALVFVPAGTTEVHALSGVAGVGGALAADDEFLYWASGPTLHRTRKSDGGTGVLASGEGLVVGVAVDATHVYFTQIGAPCSKLPAGFGNRDGGVRRVPKGGGPVTEIVGEQVSPGAIAVDAEHVYWAAGSNQDHYRVVRRVAK